MEFKAVVTVLLIVLSQCIPALVMECVKGAFWEFDESHLSAGNNHSSASLLMNEEGNNFSKKNDATSAFDKDCFLNEKIKLGCPFQVTENSDVNRIPQVMRSVQCASNLDSFDTCEEVNLPVLVLKKNANCTVGPNRYSLVLENVSVACLRTVRERAISPYFPQLSVPS